jgi:group I intron endonuclease
MQTKIYCLKDQKNNIRYIGKTVASLKERLRCHLKEASNISAKHHRATWIRHCLKNGFTPVIELLFEVSGDGCAEEIETIAKYKKLGYSLVNSTDGGEGVTGYIPTEETLKKLSKSLKGRKVWNKGLTGIYSKETKSKWSQIRKGKIGPRLGQSVTQETRLRQSKAKVGKKQSLCTRLKRSKTSGGKLFICLDNNKEYLFTNDAAKDLNVHQGNISACLRGVRKSTGGYRFKYVDTEN